MKMKELFEARWKVILFALLALPAPSPQFVLVFLLLVFEIFTSGLSEEPGWRGFALPRLQQQHGPLLGTLILGLLWGGWHLPLFLTTWAIVGANLLTICEFVLGAMSLAIMFTWVFNHTRGACSWLSCSMHPLMPLLLRL